MTMTPREGRYRFQLQHLERRWKIVGGLLSAVPIVFVLIVYALCKLSWINPGSFVRGNQVASYYIVVVLGSCLFFGLACILQGSLYEKELEGVRRRTRKKRSKG
jgi:hypothetical protein